MPTLRILFSVHLLVRKKLVLGHEDRTSFTHDYNTPESGSSSSGLAASPAQPSPAAQL
jgi:hypothetical protein